MKKNGAFHFVISHLVPEIFKIFVLCKLGTDDVIRYDNMEVKTQSRAASSPVVPASFNVTSPVKLAGRTRLGRLAINGKSKMAEPSEESNFS